MTSFTEWLLSHAMNSYRGHLPELAKVRAWLFQLMMKLIRKLKYSQVPLNEYSVESLYTKELNLPKGSFRFMAHLMWKTFYESLSDQAKISTMESQGEFKRLMLRAKSSPQDNFIPTMDTLFAFFKAQEDAISLMSVGDENEWKEISDIIKINRCRELDWADHLRSQFVKLDVGLSSRLRKAEARQPSQLNIIKKSKGKR